MQSYWNVIPTETGHFTIARTAGAPHPAALYYTNPAITKYDIPGKHDTCRSTREDALKTAKYLTDLRVQKDLASKTRAESSEKYPNSPNETRK